MPVDTPRVPSLIETLAAALERPRELPAQVLNHVVGTYGVDRDGVGAFFAEELPKLEDYEIDLILSPVFTPTLHDQAIFAELLGGNSVASEEWPVLIEQLVVRPTRAQLMTPDGQVHFVPLREVSIERYVRRLRLDATVPEILFQLIEQVPIAAERALLTAVARRAVWENAGRREILARYLAATGVIASHRVADAVELLKLVETYEPVDVADLLARIPHWQQVLRQQISESRSPKPFFNERVQELHGGGRDQRRQDNVGLTAKEQERDFLVRLEQLLKS